LRTSKSGYREDSKRIYVNAGETEISYLTLNKTEKTEESEEMERRLSFAQGESMVFCLIYDDHPFCISGGNVKYVRTSDGYKVLIRNYTESCTPWDVSWEIHLLKRGFLGWSVVHEEKVEAKKGYECNIGHEIVGLGHGRDFELNYLIKEDGEYYLRVRIISKDTCLGRPLLRTDWSSHEKNPIKINLGFSSSRSHILSFWIMRLFSCHENRAKFRGFSFINHSVLLCPESKLRISIEKKLMIML